RHCSENHIPVDFVSSHVYGNDKSQDVFATNEDIPRNQMVCRAVKKVHDQIKASSRPNLPLIWSEFNASYMNEPAVTDASYMGPWCWHYGVTRLLNSRARPGQSSCTSRMPNSNAPRFLESIRSMGTSTRSIKNWALRAIQHKRRFSN